MDFSGWREGNACTAFSTGLETFVSSTPLGKAQLHHFSVDFFSLCILPFSLFKHKNFFLLKFFL